MNTQELEERRLITILFADLSGFTALSSKLDPEEVREVASTCFEFLNKPIVKEGGTVHKYEGDLVIALFGYPVSHEDDPERAIKASIDMMNLMPEINNALSTRLRKKTNLGLHVGINMGTVVAGEIGSKEKKEHTIMGDAVNLGSRLKDVAKTGEIIVSEPIFRASRYLFEYEAHKSVSVKGIDEPIKIFRPLCRKEKPEPKRGIQGLHSPMVGRDNELKLLNSTIERLCKGKGGVFFILGGAGVGKSRLLTELKELITNNQSPIRILEGRCLSYGNTLTYWPIIQILENFFEITENDSRKMFQEKLIRKTKEIFPDSWGELIPYLGYLFSIRFADESDEKVKYLDAKGLKVQIISSIRKLLVALSRIHPLLLIIDDYHWIDNESLELLELIFSPTHTGDSSEDTRAEALPILFLGLSRIEKDTSSHETKEHLRKSLGDDFQEIVLGPLGEKVVNKLIFNLLDVPGFPKGLKDKILEKAEGNPFYLEEIIRSLIDSGILSLSSGVWHLATSDKADISRLKIPNTVQSVIAARLDKLEQDVRDVLQMASVIGRNFYGRILERLCQLDSLMLTVHLATLEDYEYISEHKKKPESEYTFRHPFFQEVTYNSLLKSKRKELHRKVGELIEHIYHDRLDELTELLAHQYSNSNDSEKAVEWLSKAGKKAQDRYANDEAIKYFQQLVSIIKDEQLKGKETELCQAYEMLGDIYSLKAEYELAVDYYDEVYNSDGSDKITKSISKRKIADVHKNQGNYDRSLKVLGEAEAMLSGGHDQELVEISRINSLKCHIHCQKGMIKEAIENGEKALKITDELMQRPSTVRINRKVLQDNKVRALNDLAGVFIYTSKYDKAIKFYEEAIRITEKLDNKAKMNRLLTNLGVIYIYTGEYDRAIEISHKALRLAEVIGDKGQSTALFNNLGIAYHDVGEKDKAIEYYQKALKVSEEIGDKRGVGAALINMGTIYSSGGEYDKATESWKRALQIKEEIGDRHGYAVAIGNLSSIYESLGEFERALEYLEEALRIFKELGDKRYTSAALLMMGEHHRARGEYDKAIEFVQESLRIFENIGDKHGIGAAHCGLGEMFLKIEELDKAEEHLLKSEKLFCEANAKYEFIPLYLNLALLKTARKQRDIEQSPTKQSKTDKQRISLDKDVQTYMQTALEYSKQQGVKFREACCYYTYGKIYSAINDFKNAEENFKKTINMCKEMKDKKVLSDVLCDYAKLLKKGAAVGVYPKNAADEYFDKARKMYEELKVPHKIKECDIEQQDK